MKFKRKRGKELTDLNVIESYHDKTGIKIFYGINSVGDYEIDIFRRGKTGNWMWELIYSDPRGISPTSYLAEYQYICDRFLAKNKVARRWLRQRAYTMLYDGKPLTEYLDSSGRLKSNLFKYQEELTGLGRFC